MPIELYDAAENTINKEETMRGMIRALALGAVFCLSIAAVPGDDGTVDSACLTTEHLSLQVSEFDEAAVGNYDADLAGTITNKSTEQGYDDAVVRVDYYDTEGTLIDSEMIKVCGDIDPGETERFSQELDVPDNAVRAEWAIDCAEDDRSFLKRLKFWA